MAPVAASLHPLAFAALPWQIVLAIIVFNIVAGTISKRKQRQAKPGAKRNPQAEAETRPADARDQGDSRAAEIRRRLEEARVRESVETKRKAAEREARDAREKALRAEREARALAAETANESGTEAAQARRERAKPAAKGLLDQLARELGLELPDAIVKPAPDRGQRKSAQAASDRATRTRPPERPDMGQDARRGESDVGADRYGAGNADPRLAVVPVGAPDPGRSPSAVGPGDLSDPEALRKAFIMKIIFDKPLALQPYR